MIANELISVLGFRLTGQDALRRFNTGMDQAESKARGMTGRFERLGAAMPLVMTGAAVAGAAAGAAMVDSVKQAARFETALSNIQKKGGFTADEMSRLSDEIRDLVHSGQTTAGPIELAEAYERLAAAGIPINDLREMALLAAQTADAFGMTEEAAANAFAGFRVGLGMAQKDLRPFADLINTLADSGISDEVDIVDFVDRAGPSLKAMGLSAEQIAALGATLLNGKFAPEKAATFMEAFSGKLMNPTATKKTAEAFAELYGSAESFQDLLERDAIGTLDDFWRRLEKLDRRSQARVLQDIFGAEWAGEAQRMIALQEEAARNLAIASDPSQWLGSLDSSYQKKLKTIEAQWEVFTANLQMLKIDLGEMIIPPASNFLREATIELRNFADSIDAIKSNWTAAMDTFERLTGLRLNADGTFGDLSDPEYHSGVSIDGVQRRDPESGAAAGMAARDLAGLDEGMRAVAEWRQARQEAASAAIYAGDDHDTIQAEKQRRNMERGAMSPFAPPIVVEPPAPPVAVEPVKAEIVGEAPSWWSTLFGGGDDTTRNASANIEAATDAAAAAGAVINDNSVQTDARQFPVSVNSTVNQTITQPSAAPAAVGAATNAAVAGAVNNQASRINADPSF